MIKKPTTSSWGFTLIEIMIVIAIISVLTFGVSNIEWNTLSDLQKSSIFKNRIVSHIEEVRNNSLFWKTITQSAVLPDLWRISVSTGSIDILYSINQWSSFINYDSVPINTGEFIQNISCGTELLWAPVSIDIRWSDMSLSWNSDCLGENKVTLRVWYQAADDTVEVSILSGLIE